MAECRGWRDFLLTNVLPMAPRRVLIWNDTRRLEDTVNIDYVLRLVGNVVHLATASSSGCRRGALYLASFTGEYTVRTKARMAEHDIPVRIY
jgi:hypothetical protein